LGTGRVFLLFLKAIFSGLFGTGDRLWRIAGKELISKKTFRLPDTSYSDRLIGLRIFRRAWKELSCPEKEINDTSRVLIMDSRWSEYDLRKDYVLSVKGYNEKEIVYITKDIAFAYAKRVQSRICLLLLSFLIFPAAFFSRNRVQWALIFMEFVEIAAVVNAAGRLKVELVHFFCPAEKDANLAYLILKEAGLKVTKHPSPGALVSHNRNLLADVLALSSNYQKEEYELKLKESILVSATESWPPESYRCYEELYRSKDRVFEYRLGFYSHGGWCRVKDGKTNGLFSKPEEEERCLGILGAYLSRNPAEKLVIFLHPKEKKNLRETENYYSRWFMKDQLVLYTDNQPSTYAFCMAEIGIGSYSTILFERDYFGFKTTILREDDREFPFKGTGFYKNSFASDEELEKQVKNMFAVA
jgi:hypothetical protein